MKKWFKKICKFALIALALSLLALFISNKLVDQNAEGLIYISTDKIPHNKVGLLLGTSKYNKSGTINIFYKRRIEAAVQLFKSGKIDYVLVSGDNSTKTYDEPTTFKEDLIEAGVPEDRIVLDYAGFRTLDSIVRAKEVFGQNTFTIISQQFHNERALYIAKQHDIDAIAFNAQDAKGSTDRKVKIREAFARVKMMLDLIVGKDPKFLGQREYIGE